MSGMDHQSQQRSREGSHLAHPCVPALGETVMRGELGATAVRGEQKWEGRQQARDRETQIGKRTLTPPGHRGPIADGLLHEAGHRPTPERQPASRSPAAAEGMPGRRHIRSAGSEAAPA